MTAAGIVLGTAPYMSPEQARGKVVDKRADIWAFGAVAFEMLAGRRAFAGGDASETIASVLAREPDWSQLPAGLSATLQQFLKRCLDKDQKRRVRDIGDVLLAIDGAFDPQASTVATVPAVVATRDADCRGRPDCRRRNRSRAVAETSSGGAGRGVAFRGGPPSEPGNAQRTALLDRRRAGRPRLRLPSDGRHPSPVHRRRGAAAHSGHDRRGPIGGGRGVGLTVHGTVLLARRSTRFLPARSKSRGCLPTANVCSSRVMVTSGSTSSNPVGAAV